MRVKPIPEPPTDLDAVRRAQRAVPLVPGSEADCCGRLLSALDLQSRDVARTWLTFLRGLGLVREGPGGFVRTGVDVDRETLARGLREGVFPARELLDALDAAGSEPTTVDDAFAAVEDAVPRWERAKSHDWRGTWRTRVGHLLEWLVLAGLAERVQMDGEESTDEEDATDGEGETGYVRS